MYNIVKLCVCDDDDEDGDGRERARVLSLVVVVCGGLYRITDEFQQKTKQKGAKSFSGRFPLFLSSVDEMTCY